MTRVLFCVSEAVPLAKTGGLADVGGALPPALARHGVDVRVAMPRYRAISLDGAREAGRVTAPVGGDQVTGLVFESRLPDEDVPVWFFDQPQWFDREGLYGEGGRDYPDNLARFTFFCGAVLAWVQQQRWCPDLVHCNDWQTALIPILSHAGAPRITTLLTIHNLAYQGLFAADQWNVTGLPPSLFTPAGLEFWGKINLLKGGLVFADLLSTVSQAYAQEIQTEEYGAGLDGVLRDRRADLFGILNGVDYGVWDPSIDSLIPAAYSVEDLAGKRICKARLQQEFGLTVDAGAPVIAMVTRLADQKGIDLVAAIIEDVFSLGAQFVLLGMGEPAYHDRFEAIGARYRGQAGIRIGFDDGLAHRIEAGADIFLMPSRYEPSGLNQLYSLRYGTVPVVRRTGGLADSIVDLTPDTQAEGTANGFVFDDYTPDALLTAIRRALDAIRDQAVWRRLQQTGMRADFSWGRSAARYVELYETALARAATRTAGRG